MLAIPDLAAQITTGALTTAGAALSGYLSVTFLKTFAMTSKQMSYYYGQPLVHCYLLHAEWLTDRFDPQTDATTRTAVDRELIHAALEPAGGGAAVHPGVEGVARVRECVPAVG